jgi:hypothetical protein
LLRLLRQAVDFPTPGAAQRARLPAALATPIPFYAGRRGSRLPRLARLARFVVRHATPERTALRRAGSRTAIASSTAAVTQEITKMSQRNVDWVIGRLVTDESFRSRFARHPAATLRETVEHGFELSVLEQRALATLDHRALAEAARALDPRLQKAGSGGSA